MIQNPFNNKTSAEGANSTETMIPDTKPVLMAIDMDAYYLKNKNFPPKFLKAVQDFTDKVRQHFSIIHVWDCHAKVRRDMPTMYADMARTVRRLTAVTNPETYENHLPIGRPQTEEWVLGKTGFSAFDDTDLVHRLPKSVDLYVTGIYGDICIKETINDGLRHQYNIYALEDLILNDCDTRKQSDINYGVNAYNSKVLQALLP